MTSLKRTPLGGIVFSLLGIALVSTAQAQTPIATYDFTNTLAAAEGGAPALTATDPLGLSGFSTATVFGQADTVYNFNGNNFPTTEQAGLTLDTTGLLPSNSYAIEMVVSLSEQNNAWRRLIDVENRASDNGFYVDPSNHLALFPVIGSTTLFTPNEYYHVVLSVNSGSVSAYLNNGLEFTTVSALMNINNSNNPDELLHLFLDNTQAGGQGEFSDGSIALLRAYNTPLTTGQVNALYLEVTGATVPEPGTFALVGLGIAGLGIVARRRLAK